MRIARSTLGSPEWHRETNIARTEKSELNRIICSSRISVSGSCAVFFAAGSCALTFPLRGSHWLSASSYSCGIHRVGIMRYCINLHASNSGRGRCSRARAPALFRAIILRTACWIAIAASSLRSAAVMCDFLLFLV